MGKGDKKSKRGKIFEGTYGKSRPKPKTVKKAKVAAKAVAKTKAGAKK